MLASTFLASFGLRGMVCILRKKLACMSLARLPLRFRTTHPPCRPVRTALPHFCSVVACLLMIFLGTAVSGCTEFNRSASAFLGGARAPWRGKDLVGPRSSATLTATEIDRRTAFLTEQLDDRRLHAEAWQFGWLFVNAGGTVVSSVQAVYDKGDDRAFDIIEAVKGGIGTGYMFVSPMPGWRGAELVRQMPHQTRAEKLAQLRRAEELMREAAEHARRRKSWVVHIGNLGLNLLGAAVLLGLDSPTNAAISFGLDTALGEAQIWSRPWSPEQDWEDYVRMVKTGEIVTGHPSTSWNVAPTGRGVAFVAHF